MRQLFALYKYLNALVAQSVERFHGKEEVGGSIPLGGTKPE